MANKSLLIATAVLAVGAAAVLLLDKSHEPVKDARLGGFLLDQSVPAKADKIELKKDANGLVLVKGTDQVWHIGDEQGFAADSSKVLRLFDDLTRQKLSILVASKKEALAEFGLEPGMSLVISGKGQSLADVKLGDHRKTGGEYVAFGSEAKAYLTDQTVAATTDIDAWELKTLLNVAHGNVKAIEIVPAPGGDKPVKLSREKADTPLTVEAMPAAAKAKPNVASAETLLENLNFAKRYDASNEEAKSALAAASVAHVALFDGRTFEVKVGSVGKTKKYFIAVRGELPADSKDDKARAEIDNVNKLMTTGAFEVPSYIGQKFEKGWQDYVDEAGSGTKG